MRIAVFSAYCYPHKGGVERYVYEIYRRLAAQGIEVDIVTCNTDHAPAEELYDGLKVYRLDCWHLLGETYPIPKINRNSIRILRLLNKNVYSFINTQTRFYVISLIGFLYGKARRIPVIHTEHGTRHSYLSSRLFQYLSKVYDHTAGYLVTKYSDYQVAISEASGEFSRHLGCKTYIKVYNGIDSHKLVRRSTELRSRLGIPPGDTVITFVGRLIEAKGVQDLIVSFKEVCRQYKAKMLIVGKGNYELPLREQAEGNLNIWFLGEKTEEEIIEYLSITDIFVNPSYSEGLPTSILEAASCGCAIVATDVGGTQEIVHDGQNGILFPPRNIVALTNSIRTLIENKHLCTVYGERARETVKSKYDWDVIASYYVSFLRTIAVSP